jgi:hypothetical protein
MAESNSGVGVYRGILLPHLSAEKHGAKVGHPAISIDSNCRTGLDFKDGAGVGAGDVLEVAGEPAAFYLGFEFGEFGEAAGDLVVG